MNAWIDGETDLVDEKTFTKFGEPGWSSWNGMSPEKEFCDAVAKAVGIFGAKRVIETGVGQGYVTRRVLKSNTLTEYLAYESSASFKQSIKPYAKGFTLPAEPTPTDAVMRRCDFAIIDSDGRFRSSEIELWHKHAPKGSIIFMHDAGNGHAPSSGHVRYFSNILRLKIPGIKYANPRGSFLGWKIEPERATLDKIENLMPIQDKIEYN